MLVISPSDPKQKFICCVRATQSFCSVLRVAVTVCSNVKCIVRCPQMLYFFPLCEYCHSASIRLQEMKAFNYFSPFCWGGIKSSRRPNNEVPAIAISSALTSYRGRTGEVISSVKSCIAYTKLGMNCLRIMLIPKSLIFPDPSFLAAKSMTGLK